MKTFEAPIDVQARVTEMIQKLHELCSANGLPFVACVVLQSGEVKQRKLRAAFVDTEMDLADNSLIGAIEMLKMPGDVIPNEVVQALIFKNDELQGMSNEVPIHHTDTPVEPACVFEAPKTIQ